MPINLISIFIKNIFDVTYNLGREHEETDNVAKGRSQGLKLIRRPPNEQAPVILEVTAKEVSLPKVFIRDHWAIMAILGRQMFTTSQNPEESF